MRFKAESNTEANKGLEIAKHFLESIHDDFPWVSYGDLYTLGGVVAIQEMSGPLIAWRPGRNDLDESFIPPDGRLPDANKDESHIRQIFGRLGLSIQETVALLGAHGVGRCHSDRSGFDGPWTTSTIEFGNDFYLALLDEVWTPRKWSGPKQFRNLNTLLMMLPTDMSLLKDPEFRNWVTIYAKNEYQFFRDFSKAFSKLIELGVSFSTDSEHWNFAPLHGFRPYQSPNECKMTFQD